MCKILDKGFFTTPMALRAGYKRLYAVRYEKDGFQKTLVIIKILAAFIFQGLCNEGYGLSYENVSASKYDKLLLPHLDDF